MNEAEILQILKNNGAPPTPENMQRVLQQSGRGSEMLGRSLGLQGGMDESGPTPLMLDKLMQATSTPSQMPIAPNSESNGAPQNGAATAAPVRNAPAAAPNRQANYGPAPGPAPNRQMNYGGASAPSAAPGSVPSTGGGNNPNVLDGSATTQMANQPQGEYKSAINWDDLSIGNGLGWLAALLGVSAAARPGAPPAAPMKALPAPNKQIGYEPKLTDQSGPKMESGAPELDAKGVQRTKGMAQTPEEIAALKAQVDAENAALESAKPTEVGKAAKPKKTPAQELIEAAKRTMGRR
jgi:hypothetical protein